MRTVILDSQLLSNLQRCAARTNMRFNLNLQTPEAGHALQRGTLIHSFFNGYYGHRLATANKAEWIDCVAPGYEKFKVESIKTTLPERDINNLRRSLDQYVELYKFEPMEVLACESPFAIRLFESEEEDLRIVYVGVIDLIAKPTGSDIKVYDHKSQSRKSDYLLLDDQFEGYCTAAETNILWVNVIGLQETLKPQDKLRRVPLSYPPFVLERWKKHVIYWVKQYLVYTENNEWPENHQGCNKFQLCEYYGVCTAASDAARAWKLQSEFYVGEKWDPTKVLENRE